MSDKKQLFKNLIKQVTEIVRYPSDKNDKLMDICNLLKNNVAHYDWVGFYFVDPQKERELILGPFAGESTEHVRIPFGQGICGQAAESKSTFIIQDVSQETNYLSCSALVKSEIVLPIMKNGEIVGELDIDSHQISPFTEDDTDFLENICRLISNNML
ncbi:MAG: GAF domain-containing protein [bacterium]|nr:MAG: GAF domain-containing protein [bacterium]